MEPVNTEAGMKQRRLEFSYSAQILAAGTSRRMGVDKTYLPYNTQKTIIKHLEDRYLEAGASPVVLDVNTRFSPTGRKNPNTLIEVNSEPEKGRSHSISLGMVKVPSGNACFIQNVDNPVVDIRLLKSMLNLLRKDSYVVPVCGGKGRHPILLSPQIVEHINSLEKMEDLRHILTYYERIYYTWTDAQILLNSNTPEDYAQFTELNAT
jgi:molybdenum cofactor cytidylyltransferase